MSFLPMPRGRLVPGVGRDDAKIVIVGDYTTAFDDKQLRPFSGPNGTVLESCLHAASLIKGGVYLTNTIKTKSKYAAKFANKEYFDEGAKKEFTELGREHVAILRTELNKLKPNIIIAAGNPALRALTGLRSVDKYRGYVCMSTLLDRPTKVIPTFSPGSTLRSYINRYPIVMDLKKAKIESEFPEMRRPERKLIYNHASVEECILWMETLVDAPRLCFDIEVINHEVSCVSFAKDANIGIVIPLGPTDWMPNGWSESDEAILWRWIQKLLGTPQVTKVAQNGMFDIHFLATKCGIIVRGPLEDTMIGHSVMFPELPKGLGFLGSVYCGAQEYWKDAVNFDNIKGEN